MHPTKILEALTHSFAPSASMRTPAPFTSPVHLPIYCGHHTCPHHPAKLCLGSHSCSIVTAHLTVRDIYHLATWWVHRQNARCIPNSYTNSSSGADLGIPTDALTQTPIETGPSTNGGAQQCHRCTDAKLCVPQHMIDQPPCLGTNLVCINT